MKKYNSILILLLVLLGFEQQASAQKTVAAVVKFTGNDTSVTIRKGDNFLVELWVPNRKDYVWSMSKTAANVKFTRSQIGEAATMPGQPEQQLWFFKASAVGADSIRFVYKSPYQNEAAVEKLLRIIVEK